MMRQNLCLLSLLGLLFGVFIFAPLSNIAIAGGDITTRPSTPHQETPKSQTVNTCKPDCPSCQCKTDIENNHVKIRDHKTMEFVKHRNNCPGFPKPPRPGYEGQCAPKDVKGWMVDVLWKDHILPAMMMMTSQITAGAMQQVLMIGQFFDAKHQLETQALFQELMADAHRDYMPSEGVCEIGTAAKSLATSELKNKIAHSAFAERMLNRQLLRGDTTSRDVNSDMYSRIDLFVRKHCHKDDNGKGLNWLCAKGGQAKEQRNKDVDFTRTVESKLTLNVDFTNENANKLTADEEDLFALTTNLFGHDPLIFAPNITLANSEGKPRREATRYLDLRSVAALRSVAQNSFSAITAERSEGDKEVAPYLKKTLEELGVTDIKEIEEILGENPSYFAQMEVMTKKMVQNPVFYTELYDKPTNVLRKQAALRAVNLMQERDFYKSQLRQEAVLSVVLELMLHKEQNRVNAKLQSLQPGGEAAFK